MRRGVRRRPVAEINVVPYIDVMLVLLIIFMVTAPMMFSGVEVNLPHAATKALDAKAQEPIVLSVDQNNRYYLNFTAQPLQAIGANEVLRLVSQELSRKTNSPRVVLVKGDKTLSYEKIVAAMTILQRAGAANIGLVTLD